MSIKNILLTGDDGYNSVGTRLLIHHLKKNHTLTVVGTKEQQSGVGGRLSVQKGGSYGETTIDGVKAFWVDGSPADAMEFANVKFQDRFDLVISGVNLGENVGSAIISSGTVSAAIRSLGLRIAPQAVAISWCTPPDFYFKKHDENEALDEYLASPGQMVKEVLDLCLKEDCWSAQFLNINLPRKTSKEIQFTQLHKPIGECYPPIILQEDSSTFSYPVVAVERHIPDLNLDVAAIDAGKISITPVDLDWTDHDLLKKLNKKKYSL